MTKETKDLGAAQPRSLLRDATWALGQLRHLYSQMIGGYVRNTGAAAHGLLGPAIAKLEALIDQWNADASPPPDSSAALRCTKEQELQELERALRAAAPNLPWQTLPHWSRNELLSIAATNALPSLISDSRALLEARRLLGEARPFVEWLSTRPAAIDLLTGIDAFLRSDSERSEPARSESGGSKVVHDPSEEGR